MTRFRVWITVGLHYTNWSRSLNHISCRFSNRLTYRYSVNTNLNLPLLGLDCRSGSVMLQHTSKHIGRETERYKERDTEAHMHKFIHRWGRYTRTYWHNTHIYIHTHIYNTCTYTHSQYSWTQHTHIYIHTRIHTVKHLEGGWIGVSANLIN